MFNDTHIITGPSEQTDVAVSAEGIDIIVIFGAGPDADDSIFIPFGINDDEVGLEAVETYTVVFEILSSTNLVFPGMIIETTVNIEEDDRKLHHAFCIYITMWNVSWYSCDYCSNQLVMAQAGQYIALIGLGLGVRAKASARARDRLGLGLGPKASARARDRARASG